MHTVTWQRLPPHLTHAGLAGHGQQRLPAVLAGLVHGHVALNDCSKGLQRRGDEYTSERYVYLVPLAAISWELKSHACSVAISSGQWTGARCERCVRHVAW